MEKVKIMSGMELKDNVYVTINDKGEFAKVLKTASKEDFVKYLDLLKHVNIVELEEEKCLDAIKEINDIKRRKKSFKLIGMITLLVVQALFLIIEIWGMSLNIGLNIDLVLSHLFDACLLVLGGGIVIEMLGAISFGRDRKLQKKERGWRSKLQKLRNNKKNLYKMGRQLSIEELTFSEPKVLEPKVKDGYYPFWTTRTLENAEDLSVYEYQDFPDLGVNEALKQELMDEYELDLEEPEDVKRLGVKSLLK